MAATYRLSWWRRGVNALVRAFLRWGPGPRRTYLLTVRGRKSGRPYSTPVTLVEQRGQRWFVAPYGEVAWVRNARATRQVTLSRGGQSKTVPIVELGPAEAAPILKQYLTQVPITRPFFDVTPESPLDAFAAEAPRHPVFFIVASEILLADTPGVDTPLPGDSAS